MRILKTLWMFILMLTLSCSSGLIEEHEMLTENVRQFEKAEFQVILNQDFENPYDQKDIALNMKLISPSGDSLFLPSYFESGDQQNSTWKARFAPKETGEYFYHFEVLKNDELIKKSSDGSFQAVASDNDGFLQVKNFWTLEHDSGKPFRGIGENIGWEARSFEDPKWTYDYLLPTLANNGANFFRSWMGPYNFPLEWKKLRDTDRYSDSPEYFNPGAIKRLDEVVEMADSLGLYMMLVFDSHNAVMEDNQWELHNYNKINGGPASTPTEFFTLEESREKYKNRLRYIVARWGYSTSIGAWEFFNEIDNAVFTKSDSIIIPHKAVTSWHKEMSAYLKEIDPYNHIVTTSVSHREIEGLFALEDIDLNQMHVYKRTKQIPEEIIMYTEAFNKAFSWGEFGYEWDWNKDFSTMEKEMIHDYKIGLWYGLFHPTPILPMTWWWEYFDEQGMTPYFKGVAEINEHMLKAGNGSLEMLEITSGEIESYAVRSGENIYIYLVNHTDSEKGASILIEDKLEDMPYTLQSFVPETTVYNTLKENLEKPGLTNLPEVVLQPLEERVLILSPQNSLNQS